MYDVSNLLISPLVEYAYIGLMVEDSPAKVSNVSCNIDTVWAKASRV